MKTTIISLLLLLSLAASAQTNQQVTKDTVNNHFLTEAKDLIGNYLPVGKNGPLYTVYMLPPDTILQRIAVYKTSASALLDHAASAGFISLAKKDIDFYCLNFLTDYSLHYGTDSVKQEAFLKLMMGPRVSSDSIQSAYSATHLKQLTQAQRQRLDSLCYQAPDVNDSALFVFSGAYRKYLSDFLQHLVYSDFRADFIARKDLSLIKLQAAQQRITNAHIRDYYTYNLTGSLLKSSKDSTLKDSLYHVFMSHATNPAYRKEVETVYRNNHLFGNNMPAPDFTYTCATGGNVSLKSLRGKYVYIDVWATWCGPCKKEIPFLTKLEEEYGNRNIHFVSLSVDVPADKDKWLDYVKTNHLKGIQVIAGNAFESDFIKKFNINSIPRFILLAPDGTIIRSDALRPSNPALKEQLDKLLL